MVGGRTVGVQAKSQALAGSFGCDRSRDTDHVFDLVVADTFPVVLEGIQIKHNRDVEIGSGLEDAGLQLAAASGSAPVNGFQRIVTAIVAHANGAGRVGQELPWRTSLANGVLRAQPEVRQLDKLRVDQKACPLGELQLTSHQAKSVGRGKVGRAEGEEAAFGTAQLDLPRDGFIGPERCAAAEQLGVEQGMRQQALGAIVELVRHQLVDHQAGQSQQLTIRDPQREGDLVTHQRAFTAQGPLIRDAPKGPTTPQLGQQQRQGRQPQEHHGQPLPQQQGKHDQHNQQTTPLRFQNHWDYLSCPTDSCKLYGLAHV